MSSERSCALFEQEGVLKLERGEGPDEHVRACADCGEAYRKYLAIIEAIEAGAPTVEPRHGWRVEVLARIARSDDLALEDLGSLPPPPLLAPSVQRPRIAAMACAAALAAAIGGVVFGGPRLVEQMDERPSTRYDAPPSIPAGESAVPATSAAPAPVPAGDSPATRASQPDAGAACSACPGDPPLLDGAPLFYGPPMASLPIAPQGSLIDQIRASIESKIENAKAEVRGGGGHFEIEVVSPVFEGKGTIERQRLVYAAIAHLMGGDNAPLHAVDSLKCRTP